MTLLIIGSTLRVNGQSVTLARVAATRICMPRSSRPGVVIPPTLENRPRILSRAILDLAEQGWTAIVEFRTEPPRLGVTTGRIYLLRRHLAADAGRTTPSGHPALSRRERRVTWKGRSGAEEARSALTRREQRLPPAPSTHTIS